MATPIRMATDLRTDQAQKLTTLIRSAKAIAFVDLPVLEDPDEPMAPLLLDPKATEEVKEKY